MSDKVKKKNVGPWPREKFADWVNGKISMAEADSLSEADLYVMSDIGYKLYQQGKVDDARKVFEGLAEMSPTVGYYHSVLGAIYEAMERNEDAIVELSRAVSLNGNDIHAHVNRGEVFLRLGKIMEAAEDFKAAIELDRAGKDPAAQRARALSLITLDAIKAYRASLQAKK